MCEVTECGGDGAGELVAGQVEVLEFGEVADFWGYGAGEVAVAEVEFGDAAVGVGGYALPVRQVVPGVPGRAAAYGVGCAIGTLDSLAAPVGGVGGVVEGEECGFVVGCGVVGCGVGPGAGAVGVGGADLYVVYGVGGGVGDGGGGGVVGVGVVGPGVVGGFAVADVVVGDFGGVGCGWLPGDL